MILGPFINCWKVQCLCSWKRVNMSIADMKLTKDLKVCLTSNLKVSPLDR